MSEQNKMFTNLLVHFVVLKSKIGNPKILLQHLSERANFARNIVRKTDRQHDIPTSISNRSSHQRCSIEKVFLKNSQNSQENCQATLLKKGLWHMCFPVNFVKFLRTAFL